MSSKCILAQLTVTAGIVAMSAFVFSDRSPSSPRDDDPLAESIAELIEGLRDPSGEVRAEAAVRLMRLGPRAHPAMSPLLGCLNDKSALVRAHSAGALGRLGPAAVAPLIRALNHPEMLVRRGAVAALCLQGSHASPAREAIGRLANDDDASIRYLVAQCLMQIDSAPSFSEKI